MTLREKLIENGVKNLQAFGYTNATKDNILTDEVYSLFFEKMLKESLNEVDDNSFAAEEIKTAIKELLTEGNPLL